MIYRFPYPCDDSEYEECHPHTVKLLPGIYLFQAWGAQGGGINTIPVMGGKGGYASGILKINIPKTFYVYVGHYGSSWNDPDKYAYIGGGKAQTSGGGGGATDFRLELGEHNETKSLQSRILVAGGGGGADYASNILYEGGVGGGVKGGDGSDGKGGDQSSGCGMILGMGESATCNTAAGGGGYYGGEAAKCVEAGRGAGGGSGYVSGHEQCGNHPSNLVFQTPVLIDGNNPFPTIDDISYSILETGHELNGYAKITKLSNLYINSCLKSHSSNFCLYVIYLFFYSKI